MRRLAIALLFLVGCTDDRDAINSREDHVFQLRDTDYTPEDEIDSGITLKFVDLDDDDRGLTWKGEVDEGIRHLERLDVGSCYRLPLREPEQVSCAEHD